MVIVVVFVEYLSRIKTKRNETRNTDEVLRGSPISLFNLEYNVWVFSL